MTWLVKLLNLGGVSNLGKDIKASRIHCKGPILLPPQGRWMGHPFPLKICKQNVFHARNVGSEW